MKRKQFTILALSGVLLLTGCGNNTNKDNTSTNSVLINSDLNDSVSQNNDNLSEYDVIGEIIAFTEEGVHILSGDMIEVFPIFIEDQKYFYIGQQVMVHQELENMYSLIPYEQKDFSKRFTTMGDEILREEGLLTEINENYFTFDINGDIKIFEYSGLNNFTINQLYSFDYIAFSDTPIIVNLYDLSTELFVTISEEKRNENGELILTVNYEGLTYDLSIKDSIVNFNYQDLSVGSEIQLFINEPLKSKEVNYPSRVDLITMATKGFTTLDYEVIGEVIAIENKDVHILSGDMVNIYYIPDGLENIYLGERVQLHQEDNKIVIEAYLNDSFENRFDTMGNSIQTLVGKLVDFEKVGDETRITLSTDDQTKILSYTGDFFFTRGDNYEFDVVSYTPDYYTIMHVYHEHMKLYLKITEMNRSEQGELILTAEDTSGGIYIIPTRTAYKNFNLSELAMADEIIVYADLIMESFPMQVQTSKITKK
ncbi:MAG: hypothetical protein JXR88_00345 [Clostridia bacterium]|nr:hypothetical protein [Clostridia bacterium]